MYIVTEGLDEPWEDSRVITDALDIAELIFALDDGEAIQVRRADYLVTKEPPAVANTNTITGGTFAGPVFQSGQNLEIQGTVTGRMSHKAPFFRVLNGGKE